MKKILNISGTPQPIGPYSQAVLVNNMLFLSGQIALDPTTGELLQDEIKTQTGRIMENIRLLLAEAGMDFSHVVKTTIYLADMNDFTMVNEVYAKYFTSYFPARETIQAARLPKDARVEISVVACK